MVRQHVALIAALSAAGAAALSGTAAGQCNPAEAPCLPSVATIAFASSMATPDAATRAQIYNAMEIYLINPDGTDVRRLTDNPYLDAFATLSPDGLGRIVFDSNRLRVVGQAPINTSDLFFMKVDASEPERHLVRGASPTWSPNARFIAYHASASGIGVPVSIIIGAATTDSDIFIANVDDLLDGIGVPLNVTNNPLTVDDDPDWSPDGQRLAFTSHLVSDTGGTNRANFVTAEIYTIKLDGSETAIRLTSNESEERAPDWSPDGTRLLFMCRREGYGNDFELCVMNANGTGEEILTNNDTGDLSPKWSPDGLTIVFHRETPQGFNQLWTMNADGSGERMLTMCQGMNLPAPGCADTNVPFPGHNLFADWGILKIQKPSGETAIAARVAHRTESESASLRLCDGGG